MEKAASIDAHPTAFGMARHVGFDERGTLRGKTVPARTKAEAIKKLREVQHHLEDGLPAPDDQMTVNQLLNRWFEEVMRYRVQPVPLENYRSTATHHLKPTLGRRRMAKLTPAEVDGLVSGKLDAGYSVSTARRVRAVLSEALDQAVRWGVVGGMSSRSRAARKQPDVKGRTLTPAQARHLLTSVSGHRLEAFFVTMLALGLRPGEALGMSWDDIDFVRGPDRP